MGDAFGRGYSGLAKARLLLRNELYPTYPYRGNFKLNYVFCEVFGTDFCCLFTLGDAFGPGYFGLAYARLLLRNEPSPAYPYRIFYLKYDLGDVFCLDFCCLFTLGDAFGPG